jgi:uncharacterized protein YjbI with pentapeptide repeats
VGGLGVRVVDGAFLERYRVRTDELREKARSGGAEEGFALGAYLTRWGDTEALKVYQDLLDRYDRDADAYLGIGIARSRRGDFAESEAAFRNAASIEPSLTSIRETRLKQLPLGANDRWTRGERATFLLLGEFVEYGQDWSGLPLNPKCSGEGATFWHDYFDASDMTACTFRRSKFEEVSFVATKLAGVPFDFADLKVVNFSNADLNGASFKSADLANVTWAGADLRNADFARTRSAGPFEDVDLRGASFAGALRPGPFIASGRDKKFSLDGVSFRGATVAISAFLLTPENTMADSPRADIGGADFTDVVLDCGERNREQMKQSLKSARDLLLPSYQAEQELVSQIRDTWPGVTLTERCREFLATEL